MKDGYYLSTYLHIDELSHLLEVPVRHDQNMSLWNKTGDNIQLVRYWELERITGNKQHKQSFFSVKDAKEFIEFSLRPLALSLSDLNEIWGTPLLHTNNSYHSQWEYPNLAFHSVAHLFSAVLMQSDIFYNEKMIGLAVDGGPDYVIPNSEDHACYSGCVSENGSIKSIFPVYSPGVLWEFVSQYYKMREGTLMALASASESRLLNEADEPLVLIDNNNKGTKEVYDFILGLIAKVEGLDGNDTGVLFSGFDPRFSVEDNKISMVMKQIQKMSIRIMEHNIDLILDKTNLNPSEAYLAMAGGYALNCPTNSHLMQKYNFKGFIAPPCVSDTGMSMGIALYAFHKRMDKMEFSFPHAYQGEIDAHVSDVLESEEFASFVKTVNPLNEAEFVRDIIQEPLVWFNEAAEIGPRALGNRSILADPRKKSSKERLNAVKKRQWWRPVAPIILEEHVGEWFVNAYASPYMLHTFLISESKRKRIPAIAHLDQTARVQTMNEKENPLLYKLIQAFREETNVPILCNTSLNDNGEPIINTIREALNFALRKEFKVVYLNGLRVELVNHGQYRNEKPLTRSGIKTKKSQEREALLELWNPFGFTKEELANYYSNPQLHNHLSITSEMDAKAIKKFVRLSGIGQHLDVLKEQVGQR